VAVNLAWLIVVVSYASVLVSVILCCLMCVQEYTEKQEAGWNGYLAARAVRWWPRNTVIKYPRQKAFVAAD